MSSNEFYAETLVVGAGPVGLTAALALRSKGLGVTVMEAEPEGRLRPGSRAIFIHKATLQSIEQIVPGLGREIASQGLVWPTKRTFWRGREVFVRHYPTPDPTKLPPFSSLPQVEIERYLMAACQKAGVDFVWSSSVSQVETSPDGVKVTTSGGQVWTTKYLIGADGSRSGVRRALGIEMEGSRSENSYVVVDVSENPAAPLPLERVFHYEHPGAGHRNILIVPFKGGWRVDLQCLEEDNPNDFSTEEGVKRWLSKVMPAKYAECITWISTYQFLQLVAKQFTDSNRRVLLVGEAAHLFAPFGARGMNSGVADAVSAATAIDAALNAPDAATANNLIEEAANTRLTAARYNRDAAGLALNHIHASTRVMKTKRVLAALVAPYWKKAGAWLDEGPYGPRSGPPGQAASKY